MSLAQEGEALHRLPGPIRAEHIAQHSKNKVQERAADGERFGQLHDELRSRGVPELDKFTVFLQRVTRGETELGKIADSENPADYLTKLLPAKKEQRSQAYATNSRNAVRVRGGC